MDLTPQMVPELVMGNPRRRSRARAFALVRAAFRLAARNDHSYPRPFSRSIVLVFRPEVHGKSFLLTLIFLSLQRGG